MRLIDADALRERYKNVKWITGADGAAAVHLLNIAPTIDPVKHGHWKYDHWCEFKCSECGEFSKTDPRGLEKYCPFCGAKMDGEE